MDFPSKMSNNTRMWKQDSEKKNVRDYCTKMQNARYDKTHGQGLLLLTPKQMLPIILAQLKAAVYICKLVNEICPIIYSLYRAK